jgi:uncharacterized membrane protein
LEGYSYKEIGLLLGAAVGCVFSVFGFTRTGNGLSFMLTGIGIAFGVIIGSVVDQRNKKI